MKATISINCLLILGCGYVGTKLARSCIQNGISVKATVRKQAALEQLQKIGIDACLNDNPSLLSKPWLSHCDAILDSVPLGYESNRTPSQTQTQSAWVKSLLKNMPHLKWAGYLSSTSVYADSHGDWIDETTTHFSQSDRGLERLKAEKVWQESSDVAEVFRLAGIYGDERNILSKIRAGDYQTIAWNPPHYSNRIHVDDIVRALLQAMFHPESGRILNISDDEPCPHDLYARTIAEEIGASIPLALTPEEAQQQLSKKYISFFSDNKRTSNKRLHQSLLPELKYPSFRDAISTLNKGTS